MNNDQNTSWLTEMFCEMKLTQVSHKA